MTNKVIYAVFDSSGSNLEMGKSRLSRNLARTIVQLKNIHTKVEYSNVDFELYTLNEQLQSISLNSSGDIPAFKSIGTTNIDLLLSFIDNLGRNKEHCPILFFTDGNFKNQDIERLANTLKINTNIHLILVPIGLDADINKLSKLETTTFTSDNVLMAIDYAITFILGNIKTPKSLDDILEIDENSLFLNAENVENDEDDDSWE